MMQSLPNPDLHRFLQPHTQRTRSSRPPLSTARKKRSPRSERWTVQVRQKWFHSLYRVFYFTGPTPKSSKCQPVSKCFQKKLEYLDWSPLKFLHKCPDWSPLKFLSVWTGPPFSTKIFKYRKTAKERERKGGTSLGTLPFWAGPV